MRETPHERARAQLKRLPALGALGAGAALLLSSIVPSMAFAEDQPAEETDEAVHIAADDDQDADTCEDQDTAEAAGTAEEPAAAEDCEDEADTDSVDASTLSTEEHQDAAAADSEEDALVDDEAEAELQVGNAAAEEDATHEDLDAAAEEETAHQGEDAAAQDTLPDSEILLEEPAEADELLADEATEARLEDEALTLGEETADEGAEEELDHPEAEEVQLFQDEDDEDESEVVEYRINPTATTQSALARNGVQVIGYTFAASTEAVVTVDGETVHTSETTTAGWFDENVLMQLEPGSYTVGLTVGSDSMETSLTVEEGGYDLGLCVGSSTDCYFDESAAITTWELSRQGVEFEGTGFNPGSAITITANDAVVGEGTTDEFGALEGTFTADLAPGTYSVTLSAAEGSISYDMTVLADDDGWDHHDGVPTANPSRSVVAESELAAEPVTFRLSGFPYQTWIDVHINGEFVESVYHTGSLDYELPGTYGVGEILVEFKHPVADVAITIPVVPDEQGELPYAGSWAGQSEQTRAGGYDWGELEDHDMGDHIRPISLTLDESGNLTDLNGEYWWVCVGVQTGYIDSGYTDLETSQIPTTPMTLDQPFEIVWDNVAYDFVLTGQLNSDGTASGTLHATLGACGTSVLNWSTEFDGEVPAPEPTPEPEPEPEPTPEPDPTPDPEPTPEPDPTPTPDPTTDPTTDPSEDPEPTQDPEPSPDPTDPAPESTEDPAPTAEPTTEPTEETIPSAAPAVEDLEDEALGSVSAPAQAQAGDEVTVSLDGVEDGTEVGAWLFSEPVSLGTHTVAEASITVTIPADTAAGEHQIAVWSAEGLVGWDTITITAAAGEVADGEGSEPAGTGDDAAPAGSTDGDSATGDGAETTSEATSAEGAAADSADPGTSGASSSDGEGLAVTGTSAAVVGALAALLLAAGAVFLVLRRRGRATM